MALVLILLQLGKFVPLRSPRTAHYYSNTGTNPTLACLAARECDGEDERGIAILRNCHLAIKEQGKLRIVERVNPPGHEPSYAKLGDLNMLVLYVGRESAETEYRALFAAAGFKLANIIPAHSQLGVE